MTDRRIKMILNPNADMGNAWKFASELYYLAEGYGQVDWAGTVFPTHATQLARQAAEDGYDVVIAVGGDGTAHEVVNGLMEADVKKRPLFSIVPMGSGNDYANNLGIPNDPEKALKGILTGKPRWVDIGYVEDEDGRREYFDNTVNIGFGGTVTILSHRIPLLRGFLIYFVAVLQTIIAHYDILDVEIDIDGKETWKGQTLMMALCNGPREGGGFTTGPGALLDDGVLNYSITDKVSRPMMFRLIPEFMKGTQERFKQVHPGTFKKMVIHSKQPLVLHTDGEVFAGFSHNVHQLTIEILLKALEVIVPS
jgi:diacylglycerol kinase (ATP)